MKRLQRSVSALFLVLGACASPYQDATLNLPLPLASEAIDQVIAAVRVDYPHLTVDREAFRIQSSWNPLEDRGVACQRRLTLYLEDPGVLHCVVEVRYLRASMLSNPSWSASEGHSQWEYELLNRIDTLFRAMDAVSSR